MQKQLLFFLVVVSVVVAAVVVLDRPDDEPPLRPRLEVPASIASDCSRDVDVEINQFLAAAPDGATIVFPAKGCYSQHDAIRLNDRHGLTIDGNGSSFRSTNTTTGDGNRPNWGVFGGSNITLRNIHVHGTYPPGSFDEMVRTNTHPYDVRMDQQPGFILAAVQGASLLDSSATDVWGDSVLVSWDLRTGTPCSAHARDVTVQRFTGTNFGRTTAVVAGERITIADSTFRDAHDAAFDLETDAECSVLRDVKILRNRVNRHWFSFLANTGWTSDSDIEISDNVDEADPHTCWPGIYVFPPDSPTARKTNLTITGNKLRSLTTGISAARLHDSRILNNEIYKSGHKLACSAPSDSQYMVALHQPSNVEVSGNIAVGPYPYDDPP